MGLFGILEKVVAENIHGLIRRALINRFLTKFLGTNLGNYLHSMEKQTLENPFQLPSSSHCENAFLLHTKILKRAVRVNRILLRLRLLSGFIWTEARKILILILSQILIRLTKLSSRITRNIIEKIIKL